nr:low affinity immunoglobulin gamma Fc region receptor III-like [Pelodiscus sinensis]|eukprot:XP_025034020.1 low affinity immunoglobulin gamma Fc region receptor III-like [Pelodiscus sinensis]
MPAPTLTVSPSYRVFLPRESVTLTCSAPSTDTVTLIQFFRDGQKINSNVKSHQLSSVSERDAGAYSCEYWKKESEREIPSERSRPISITVTARPSVPDLTVSPQYHVFLRGESVTLKCSAPSTDTVSGIRFFRDHQRIYYGELQRYPYKARSLQLLRVSQTDAGAYSCESWKKESEREIPSERSRPISITVTASLPVPQITVSQSQPVYITGEDVTLTCSAAGSPTVSGIRFYRDSREIQSKELPSPRNSHTESLPLLSVSAGSAGEYNCESWKTVSGREITSARSQSRSIRVTDPPSQPKLSVDPPSGVVSEGFSLNITCTAPGDARERRFHFYKDGAELIPGDLGSKMSTMEPSTSSVKGSVLSIPWAGSNITGEFACGYEENVAGRWIPSLRSWTVNVTGNITVSVSAAHDFRWVREVAVGGSFFLINGLVHVSYRCF